MLVGDILRRNLKLRPRKTAITWNGREVSYGQLADRVNRAANALAALGAKKGDRVAILSQNCPEYIELYFAAGALGAVTTPLNYRLTPPELEYIVNDSEAEVLLVAPEFAGAAEAIRPRSRGCATSCRSRTGTPSSTPRPPPRPPRSSTRGT